MCMSKLIKLCALNMFAFLHINSTSMKLPKKKKEFSMKGRKEIDNSRQRNESKEFSALGFLLVGRNTQMYDAPLAFKDRGSGGSSSHGRPQGCGACCGTQTPSLLGGIPAAAIIFSFAGHPTRDMCLSYTPTLSLLPAASQGWCQAASR